MGDRLSEEELNKAKQSYNVSMMYVHYDDDNFVTAISNSKNISNRYIEVPLKRVELFLSGHKNFTGLTYDYFNFEDLPVKANKTQVNPNFLYSIPNVLNEDLDILLLIDENKNQLSFTLSDYVRKELSSRNLNDKHIFYFTKKNNQHFLYYSLEVTSKKLLSKTCIDLIIPSKEFSIYTMPVFNSYGVILK